MISVAVCTYNGARYIQEQIESILNQTIGIDEIIVCDDGSTDSTVNIINQLSTQHPSIIRLVQNRQRLGLFKNFIKAISLCSGEIIFLSDQDDIWHTDKAEIMVNYLNRHRQIELVFSDATLLGGTFNGQSMSDNLNFPPKNREMFLAGLSFELSLYQVYALGASMAIRKSLLDHISISNPIIASHDHLLQLVSSSRNTIAYIDKQLYDYRLHNNQTSNAGTKLNQIQQSINIPQDGEVWPLSELEDALTDEILKERCLYMTERNRLLHDIWGPFKIIMRPSTYCRLYRHNAWRVMRYDITRSACCARLRFKRKYNL